MEWDWNFVDRCLTISSVGLPFALAEVRHFLKEHKHGMPATTTFDRLLNYSSDLWNGLTMITLIAFSIVLLCKDFIDEFITSQTPVLILCAIFIIRFITFSFPPIRPRDRQPAENTQISAR